MTGTALRQNFRNQRASLAELEMLLGAIVAISAVAPRTEVLCTGDASRPSQFSCPSLSRYKSSGTGCISGAIVQSP